MSFSTDCAVLPDHVANACSKYAKGGFPSVAVVDKDHSITDWSNATQWNANINSGKIKIIERVKASAMDPSPVMIDNPVACSSQQVLDAFDFKIDWTDANRSEFNDEFYKKLNNKSAFVVLWNKDESKVIVFDRDCTFVAAANFPDSNRAFQYYKCEAHVSAPKDWFPTTITAPTGIFQF